MNVSVSKLALTLCVLLAVADAAVFRPSTGLWAMLKSSTGYGSARYVSWGLSTDVPIYRRP